MTGAPFTIDRITDLDAAWPDLVALFEGQTAHHGALMEPVMPDWQERLRARMTMDDDELLLIARQDVAPVGFVIARVRRNPSLWQETFVYLENIYVQETTRGSGVGRALVEAVERWTVERGVGEIRLGVMNGNEIAERFWEAGHYRDYIRTLRKLMPEAQS